MMRPGQPVFSVKVDLTNPGQFFACCGLLELSHRLWRGAEGWFCDSSFNLIAAECQREALTSLLRELDRSKLSGLGESEEEERKQIEAKRRGLGRKKQPSKRKKGSSEQSAPDEVLDGELRQEDKERLKQLGQKARKGSLFIGEPFFLTLDWWQNEDDVVPKTWAGRQEIHKIACSAQATISAMCADPERMFDYECVMMTPPEYLRGENRAPAIVEPFYFDARRFAHALDAGFSLDVQDAETVAHPAVELLCLIGLQRFRPCTGDRKWNFSYWTWLRPLSAPVAAGVVSGVVPLGDRQQYQFDLHFRDDQKRYKAFGFSRRSGERIWAMTL
jgi:CRISPR-associated protein Csb3